MVTRHKNELKKALERKPSYHSLGSNSARDKSKSKSRSPDRNAQPMFDTNQDKKSVHEDPREPPQIVDSLDSRHMQRNSKELPSVSFNDRIDHKEYFQTGSSAKRGIEVYSEPQHREPAPHLTHVERKQILKPSASKSHTSNQVEADASQSSFSFAVSPSQKPLFIQSVFLAVSLK